MRCPFCEADKDQLKVIDSRTCEGGRSIRRRRQCLQCTKRFTTYERIEEQVKLTVVKKDGRRVPWDRGKIVAGLERAAFKRPVSDEQVLRITDEVEEEVFRQFDREVPSNAVGELVADKLRRVDQVSYVRFASVYKEFKTLTDLVDEAQAILDSRRFEDPTQGRLFIEEPLVGRGRRTPRQAADGHAPGINGKAASSAGKKGKPAAGPRKPRRSKSARKSDTASDVPAGDVSNQPAG